MKTVPSRHLCGQDTPLAGPDHPPPRLPAPCGLHCLYPNVSGLETASVQVHHPKLRADGLLSPPGPVVLNDRIRQQRVTECHWARNHTSYDKNFEDRLSGNSNRLSLPPHGPDPGVMGCSLRHSLARAASTLRHGPLCTVLLSLMLGRRVRHLPRGRRGGREARSRAISCRYVKASGRGRELRACVIPGIRGSQISRPFVGLYTLGKADETLLGGWHASRSGSFLVSHLSGRVQGQQGGSELSAAPLSHWLAPQRALSPSKVTVVS